MIARVRESVVKLTSNRLIKNVGWMAGAQAINKIFRLAVTIIVARILMPEAYGMIAIIFTVFEIVNAVVRRSTQVSIVNGLDGSLGSMCQQAYFLNWKIATLAVMIQIAVAWVLVHVYQQQALFAPLVVLAAIHAMLPFAMVQAALNIREQKLDIIARIDVYQGFLEALLSIVMAISGFGLWSLIIPKVLVTPIWIAIHRKNCSWRISDVRIASRDKTHTSIGLQSFRMVCIDVVLVLRNHVDYLVIGYFLGVEALGVYYFAFNAGLGISNSIIQAAGSALLPHLSQFNTTSEKLTKQFWFSLKMLAVLVGGMVIVQSSLAPFYVPIVFGEKWVTFGAVPVLIVLCLSAVARALHELISQWLRAQNQIALDLYGQIFITIVMAVAVILSAPFGIFGIALAVTISLSVSIFGFSCYAYRALTKPEAKLAEQAQVNPLV